MSNARPRRIGYINHEIECGGAEISLLDLIGGLDRDRFTPILITSGEGPLSAAARARGAEVRLLPMLFRGKTRKLLGVLRASAGLRRLVGELGCDLLHANTLIGGYCALAARRPNLPLVWHVRVTGYPSLALRAAGRADRILANSRATARSLPERHQARVRVIYNGIDPAFFEANESGRAWRRELGVADDSPLIGMVGRLDPAKGHAMFLEAAREIRAACPRAQFVIVGDVILDAARRALAHYASELRELAASLGLGEAVHFTGEVEDMPAVMAGIDLLAHPTLEAEAFGRVLAEAHAAGKPVVASALGGIGEVVEDGRNGHLVPPGEAKALARGLLSLLADPDRAAHMGALGREQALHRFTVSRHVTEVQAVYDELR